MIKWLLPLFLIFFPPWVQAGSVYKWVDEKGVVHFSSKPLNEAEPESIQTLERLQPSVSTNEPERRSETPRVSPLETVEEVQQEGEVIQINSQHNEQTRYCNSLKFNLNALKTSDQVRRRNERGELVVLGDLARQEEIRKIERAIDESCPL